MQSLTNVADATNQITREQFKELTGESENIVTNTGQTLSQSDLGQVEKGVATYAVRGDYFQDSGTANNIILSPLNSMKYPITLEYGLRIRFKPAYSNSSQSVTITLGSLGSNGLSKDLLGGAIVTPIIEVGYLDTDRVYTAVFSTNGPADYWLLENTVKTGDLNDNVVTRESIASNAVSTSKLGLNAVTTDKITNEAVTNDKLYNNISLEKINNGELDIVLAGPGGTDRVRLDVERMLYGTDDIPNFKISRLGIEFEGTGAPGNTTPPNRWAIYSIAAQTAAASTADASTRTDFTTTAHSHRVGTQYVFAANLNTEIPNGSAIFGSTITYTEITTGRIVSAPVVVTAVQGATYLEIISMSVHYVKDADIEFYPDDSEPIYLAIHYSGTLL